MNASAQVSVPPLSSEFYVLERYGSPAKYKLDVTVAVEAAQV